MFDEMGSTWGLAWLHIMAFVYTYFVSEAYREGGGVVLFVVIQD